MKEHMTLKEKVYIILTGIFVGCLIMSTVLARKPIIVGGLLVNFAVFVYAVTFVITDVVSEIWGRERARFLIISGFISLVVAYLWTNLGLLWPGASFWEHQEAFTVILGSTSRVMTGGMIAYLVAQFYDVWIFLFLKRKTKGKHLWFRTNTSTFIAQTIDTFIFITIGFYGVLPLKPMIIGVLTIKISIALVAQFLVYLTVWILRKPKFELTPRETLESTN